MNEMGAHADIGIEQEVAAVVVVDPVVVEEDVRSGEPERAHIKGPSNRWRCVDWWALARGKPRWSGAPRLVWSVGAGRWWRSRRAWAARSVAAVVSGPWSDRRARAASAMVESCAIEPTKPSGHSGIPAAPLRIGRGAIPIRCISSRATMRAAPLARCTLTTLCAKAFCSSGSNPSSSPWAMMRWPIHTPGIAMSRRAASSGGLLTIVIMPV